MVGEFIRARTGIGVKRVMLMKFIFIKILFMSISMSLAGLALTGVTRVFKNLFTQRQRYYMWLVPFILAIVPVVVSGPTINITRDTYQRGVSEAAVVETMPNVTESAVNDAAAEIVTNGTETAVQPLSAERKSFKLSIDIVMLIAYAYVLGVLIIAAYTIIRAAKFKSKFNQIAERIELDILPECMQRLGVSREVSVYKINGDGTPFVYGIINPKLVLPNGKITREALLHELTHIKRRDLTYMLFAHIIRIIHFFNPLVYIFNADLRKTMELSCDETVSVQLNGDERIAYGRSILNCSVHNSSAGIVCLSENGRNVKERIEVIMKVTKRNKAAVLVSTVLVLTILAGQTALAAAVNNNAPARNYMINSTDEVFSVVYENAESDKWWYSGFSGRKMGNIATLVNTPFYKGFSADLEVTFTPPSYREYVDTMDADIHIEMTEFIKSMDNGRAWQGKYDVIMNGELIFDDAMGYLQEIPGEGYRDVSRLYIEDGEKKFRLEHMDFNTKNDDAINKQWEVDQAESFDVTNSRFVTGTRTLIYGDSKTETDTSSFEVHSNPAEGKLLIESMSMSTDDTLLKYITTVPDETYKFDGNNKASGKFFVKESGNIIMDEFEATITGLEGGDITFTSNSENVPIKIMYTNLSTDEAAKEWYETGAYRSYEGADYSDFEKSIVSTWHRLRLSDLPFTLTLNEDKTKVIMQLKDGFDPYMWTYSYASYVGGSDSNVYQKGSKDDGVRTVELGLCKDFGSHNLQFTAYYPDPKAKKVYYDIMFRMVNGKMYYTGCSEYIDESKTYSGEAAIKWIDELSSYLRWINN